MEENTWCMIVQNCAYVQASVELKLIRGIIIIKKETEGRQGSYQQVSRSTPVMRIPQLGVMDEILHSCADQGSPGKLSDLE